MGCITWSTKMAPASLSSPYSSIYAQMIDAPMEDPTTRTSYNTSQGGILLSNSACFMPAAERHNRTGFRTDT